MCSSRKGRKVYQNIWIFISSRHAEVWMFVQSLSKCIWVFWLGKSIGNLARSNFLMRLPLIPLSFSQASKNTTKCFIPFFSQLKMEKMRNVKIKQLIKYFPTLRKRLGSVQVCVFLQGFRFALVLCKLVQRTQVCMWIALILVVRTAPVSFNGLHNSSIVSRFQSTVFTRGFYPYMQPHSQFFPTSWYYGVLFFSSCPDT